MSSEEIKDESLEEKKKDLQKQIIYYEPIEEVDLNTIDAKCETIDLSQTRVSVIENFSKFTNLKTISFRANFLKTLQSENLKADRGLSQIVDIDFYDNQIEKIENLSELTTLQSLDLSFNRIKKIENLEKLVNLKKLFLVHNHLSKIENLECLIQLEMLELGDNQIRQIDNIESLKQLKQL
jgi:protein phosphatase 1 regulatory subunit 7